MPADLRGPFRLTAMQKRGGSMFLLVIVLIATIVFVLQGPLPGIVIDFIKTSPVLSNLAIPF